MLCLADSEATRCARGDVVNVFLTTHVRSKRKVVAMIVCLSQETRWKCVTTCVFLSIRMDGKSKSVGVVKILNDICRCIIVVISSQRTCPPNWTHFGCIHKWITRLFIFSNTIKGKLIILLYFRPQSIFENVKLSFFLLYAALNNTLEITMQGGTNIHILSCPRKRRLCSELNALWTSVKLKKKTASDSIPNLVYLSAKTE